jgi:SpoVK/Ycf46/Vps4 family AAA+-type ATPase
MVLVVTATQSISRLKPALRALFPSELVCNTFSDAKVQEYMDSIFTAVISDDRNVNDDDNIVNKDLNNDNSYGKSDSDDESKGLNDNLLSKQSISQDLVSVKNKINGDNQKVQKKILEVASQMSGDGGKGVTKLILKEVVDETITRSLQRLSGASWLKECGLSNGKPKGLSNGVDSSFSSLVLSPIDGISLVEKDVNRAALSLSRSHVRTGGVGASNSSGGEGGAKVSPVHWEDIGGLDRVRKEILDILQLPSLRPELFPAGSSMRRGISLSAHQALTLNLNSDP